jgi:hypothetical protein
VLSIVVLEWLGKPTPVCVSNTHGKRGRTLLIDATYHTNLLGGLNDIIATRATVGKTGTLSQLTTAAELLNQCRTYTLHIEKMICGDGEELPSHVAFVDGMKGELERYDHHSSLSA